MCHIPKEFKMFHFILCGDSIFDNKACVEKNQPDVTNQVSVLLSEGSRVSRLAVDGGLTGDVIYQLDSLPKDATHIFVSTGGNDALRQMGIFSHQVNNVGESLIELHRIREQFKRIYSKMLNKALSFGLPLTVCTIYYHRFLNTEGCKSRLSNMLSDFDSESRKVFQKISVVALSIFNDVITKVALERRVSLIDLRVLCNDESEFAGPVEPSMIGGQKIANAIVNASLNSAGVASEVHC